MTRIGTVINFEVVRTLRKRTFWFASIAPPLLILLITGITHFSSQSADNAAQQQTSLSGGTSVAVLDETGIVNRQLLAKEHITTEPTKHAGIAAVQHGDLSGFIYYPKNIDKETIQVYAQDQGINNATPYSGLATALLVDSAKAKALAAIHNPQLVQLLEATPNVTATTYKNGRQINDEANLIAPGIFLIAFLTLVVLQAYLMITSTTEEKENRTAEILLTSIPSRSLITGKILSLFILGIVQLLVIIIPVLLIYLAFGQHLNLQGASLRHIPLDPKAITFGALFFVTGIVVVTGFLVGFGSLFPSAQEAGRYMGFAIITTFLPIYAIGYIISSTHTLVITIFTFFPLTAPTTLLIRNAIGTIPTGEAFLALGVMIGFAVIAIMFAMKAFRYSAMEYGRRVSIKEILHA